MTNPLFVLDTNIFIEAHRRYYAHDLCPGFWECLRYHCRQGRVLSIDRVRTEILRNQDRLAAWVRQAPDNLFVSSAEQSVANVFTKMMDWVQGNRQFRPEAKEEFARIADGWIAAMPRFITQSSLPMRYLARISRKKCLCPMCANSSVLTIRTPLQCCGSLRCIFTGGMHNDH